MIHNNAEEHRFELAVDGEIAFVTYREDDNRIVLQHTEVPQALSGRGVGSQLVRGVLDHLRADDRQVVPQCPFIATYIERHPGYADLVSR